MSKKTNGQDSLHAATEARQAELETQNEQLRQLQAVLEKSLAHYADFFEYAHIGYLVLNHKCMIDEINFTGAAMLGVARSKLIHHSFNSCVAAEDRQRWQNHFIKVITSDDKLTCEVVLQHDGASRFDAQLDCQCIRKTDKELAVRVALTNITERKRIEADLRASEASMRAILDNSPYLAWLKDSESRYVQVNKSYAEYARLKDAQQVIGKTDFDLWPRELAEKYRTDDDEVMATRWQKHVEERSLDGDRIHWVETFKTPIIDENGNVLGTAGVAMDITERKQAEEKLQRFFDLIPELACIASTDGHLLKINPAWQTTLGYTEQEILSTPFLDFIHPDDRGATMKEVERQLIGEATMRFTNRYRHKDGSYRWLEWTATSDVDKKLLYASARDITARKQAGE
ncbi:MAG: PAS domain S-box protein [Gallionella sp.]|nr:PAS domain S-box protein [Gallionella sp.]